MPGLDAPPYPGPKGQDIFEKICKQAWEKWQSHQTMLINEKQLSLIDPEARKYLQQEMDKFFAGEEYNKTEGYVPPESYGECLVHRERFCRQAVDNVIGYKEVSEQVLALTCECPRCLMDTVCAYRDIALYHL
jgi:Fe-S cluster biosynthesis and repair protein YggX